jgi:hypothetical protein
VLLLVLVILLELVVAVVEIQAVDQVFFARFATSEHALANRVVIKVVHQITVVRVVTAAPL